MTWALLLVPVSIVLASAIAAGVAADGRTARTRLSVGVAVAFVLALASAFLLRVDRAFERAGGFTTAGPPLGLDGLSAPLFPFVAGLLLAVALGTPARFAHPRSFARLGATGAVFLGLLAARDPGVVAVLWLVSAAPMLLELRAHASGRVFLIHRIASTSLIAFGLALTTRPALSSWAAPLVVLGVFVRQGIFPFHAWVPRFFERAPLGSALFFLEPRVGAYVLARFVADGSLGPAALLFDVLAVVTALYGSGLALAQSSPRRALGYLSVSQSALVLVGLAGGGVLGATGALVVIIACGLAHTGFGLAIWATEARRGALRLDVDGGGHSATPALAGATLVLGLATVGVPGTLAFVATDFVFQAAIEARPWVGMAIVLSTALNGINVVRIAFRLFGGCRRTTGEGDLTLRERVVFGLVGATLVGLGLLPQPVLEPARAVFEQLGLRERAPSTGFRDATGAEARSSRHQSSAHGDAAELGASEPPPEVLDRARQPFLE